MDARIPAPIKTGAEAYAYAERLKAARRRRTRRRLAALGALLVLGLALGTIYATGFATSGGTNATPTSATPLTMSSGDEQDTSGLNGLLSNSCPGCSANLTYNWSGRNGSLSAAVMYDVNLTGEDPLNKYYVSVYLTNTPVGFSDLQIQMRIAKDGGDGCTTTDLSTGATVGTGTGNFRNMIFDTNDAQVTWQGWVASGPTAGTGGLDGGQRYCVGVIAGGGNPNGTFIRRATANTTTTPPAFVSTVNQMPS